MSVIAERSGRRVPRRARGRGCHDHGLASLMISWWDRSRRCGVHFCSDHAGGVEPNPGNQVGDPAPGVDRLAHRLMRSNDHSIVASSRRVEVDCRECHDSARWAGTTDVGIQARHERPSVVDGLDILKRDRSETLPPRNVLRSVAEGWRDGNLIGAICDSPDSPMKVRRPKPTCRFQNIPAPRFPRSRRRH